MIRIENPRLEHAALLRCIAKHHDTTPPGMTVEALHVAANIIENQEKEAAE